MSVRATVSLGLVFLIGGCVATPPDSEPESPAQSEAAEEPEEHPPEDQEDLAPDEGKVSIDWFVTWRRLPESASARAGVDDRFPYGGMRSFYHHLRSMLHLGSLKRAFGGPAFLSGPHGDTLSLDQSSSFGHYNPRFVQWLEQALPAGQEERGTWSPANAGSKVWRMESSPVYTYFVRPTARAFYEVLQRLHANPSCARRELERYREAIVAGVAGYYQRWSRFLEPGFCASLQDPGVGAHDKLRLAGLVNEDVVREAVGFWLRRELDGTQTDFRRLLEKLLVTYDAEWLSWRRAIVRAEIDAGGERAAGASSTEASRVDLQTLRVGDWNLVHSVDRGTATHRNTGEERLLWGLSGRGKGSRRCDESAHGRLLSVVGAVVSYESSGGGYCKGAAHGWANHSYETRDLARSHVDGVATLERFFDPEEIRATLDAHPYMVRAREEKNEIFRCDVQEPKPESSVFAFHGFRGAKVLVSLGLGHVCEASRGNFTRIELEMTPKPEVVEALRRADGVGLLARDLAVGEMTLPTGANPQTMRVGEWVLVHSGARGMAFHTETGKVRHLWRPYDEGTVEEGDRPQRCWDLGSWGRLVSVVGSRVSYEALVWGHCWDETRATKRHAFTAVDLALVDHKGHLGLDQLFGVRAMKKALDKEPWLKQARADLEYYCVYQEPTPQTDLFALQGIRKGRVVVRLGLPHRLEVGDDCLHERGMFTLLDLELTPKPALRAAMKHAQRQRLLGRDLRARLGKHEPGSPRPPLLPTRTSSDEQASSGEVDPWWRTHDKHNHPMASNLCWQYGVCGPSKLQGRHALCRKGVGCRWDGLCHYVVQITREVGAPPSLHPVLWARERAGRLQVLDQGKFHTHPVSTSQLEWGLVEHYLMEEDTDLSTAYRLRGAHGTKPGIPHFFELTSIFDHWDGDGPPQAGLCVPAQHAHCEEARICKKFGRCRLRQHRCEWAADSGTGDCDRPLGTAQVNPCRRFGYCGVRDAICVATSDAHCAASRACKVDGRCRAHPYDVKTDPHNVGCIPTPEGCAQSEGCRRDGRCALFEGQSAPTCHVSSDADCRGSESCRSLGLCGAFLGARGRTCGATSTADCQQSRVCREEFRCILRSRECAAAPQQ